MMLLKTFSKKKSMDCRHKIDRAYNENPRHRRRWELTIKWLKQFDIKGRCLDCGNFSNMTNAMALSFGVRIDNTTHDLNWIAPFPKIEYDNIFIFEIIEHLLNPAQFLLWIGGAAMKKNSSIYLSTPINRPKWMRNKKLHFHEFNYNELVYLIDKAGFKIVNEKRINCTTWKMITGFRPLLRFFGIDQNILLRLKRK